LTLVMALACNRRNLAVLTMDDAPDHKCLAPDGLEPGRRYPRATACERPPAAGSPSGV